MIHTLRRFITHMYIYLGVVLWWLCFNVKQVKQGWWSENKLSNIPDVELAIFSEYLQIKLSIKIPPSFSHGCQQIKSCLRVNCIVPHPFREYVQGTIMVADSCQLVYAFPRILAFWARMRVYENNQREREKYEDARIREREFARKNRDYPIRWGLEIARIPGNADTRWDESATIRTRVVKQCIRVYHISKLVNRHNLALTVKFSIITGIG